MYYHNSTDVLICFVLDSLESRSTHEALSFTLSDPMASLYSYMITCTHPLCVNEV